MALFLCLLAPSLRADEIVVGQPGARLTYSSPGLTADGKLRLGHELTIVVVVDSDGPLAVEAAPFEPDAAQWDIIDKPEPKTSPRRWERTVVLDPRAVGSLPLPAMVLRVRAAEVRTIRFEPRGFEVVVPKGVQGSSIRGETDVERIPTVSDEASFSWPMLILVLGGWLVVLGGVLWMRQPRPGPKVSPFERALAELEKLGDDDKAHERISLVLRGYVEERFGLPALKRTTEEVRTAAMSCEGLDEAAREELYGLLERCDRVRFAPVAGAAEESGTLRTEARGWIERTRSNGSGEPAG